MFINSDIMYEAEHGKIDISEWPAFLYPLGSSPDVEDDQLGLFRGYLHKWVFVLTYYEQK